MQKYKNEYFIPERTSKIIATVSSIVFFSFCHTGSAQKHSTTHWCLQNIAQESVDSSDEEFFDARGWCPSYFPVLSCFILAGVFFKDFRHVLVLIPSCFNFKKLRFAIFKF